MVKGIGNIKPVKEMLEEVINEPRQALSMRTDDVVLFASDTLLEQHAFTPVNAVNDVVILT